MHRLGRKYGLRILNVLRFKTTTKWLPFSPCFPVSQLRIGALNPRSVDTLAACYQYSYIWLGNARPLLVSVRMTGSLTNIPGPAVNAWCHIFSNSVFLCRSVLTYTIEFTKIVIKTGDSIWIHLPWSNSTSSVISLVMAVLVPYLIHGLNTSLCKVITVILINLYSHRFETDQPQYLLAS